MPRWVPKNIEWFLAELMQEFTFANGDGPLLWVNTILVQATSLEEGYSKAMERGEVYNEKYTNTDQVEVTCKFRGLRDLYLIYEKLEDGAELIWTEYDDLDEAQIAAMVTEKDSLAAFLTHGQELPETRRVEEAKPESDEGSETIQIETAEELNREAKLKRNEGEFAEAVSLHEQALLIFRKLDRPAERAYTLRHVADLHSELGELTKAKREIEEAINFYRDTPYGKPLDLANALRVSALNTERQANKLWQEARSLYGSLKIDAGVDEAHVHIQHLTSATEPGEAQ